MMSSLCEGNLEHYFVPSNLFAGKKKDAMLKIASRVAEIQDDRLYSDLWLPLL
jgi:hypothetical protein